MYKLRPRSRLVNGPSMRHVEMMKNVKVIEVFKTPLKQVSHAKTGQQLLHICLDPLLLKQLQQKIKPRILSVTSVEIQMVKLEFGATQPQHAQKTI